MPVNLKVKMLNLSLILVYRVPRDNSPGSNESKVFAVTV